MISIIIPVYNQADKLSRCLESILNQTILTSPHPSPSQGEGVLEVIIVNDGSTDDVSDRIKNYPLRRSFSEASELRIKNFKVINQENSGSNPARNRGAKEASGEYIIFCDADIIMKPEMLEVMLYTLKKNPQASYAYSSFKYGWKSFKLWPFDAEKLKTMPYIHTTSLIRRETFPGFSAKGGPAFGWDESIERLQDWDLWLTMLEQGHKGIWVNKILFKAQGGGTISNWLPSFAYKLFPLLKGVKKYKAAEEIIRKKHKLNVIARSSPR